ncbi:ImmA/IrrE family metallo-endopeptidase [Kitasatospora herbaricolor]|uniref:ImmA/IrrE family metallo-endopeptidase n=1 Tax=Kitasatospora herbaricolor TaxID=68217 RepID=UPI0036D94CD5
METMTGRGYDPWEHAGRLGLNVVYRSLRTGNGLWVPQIRTIFLQTRLRAIHERSVLAHEVGHACMGHVESSPRYELQADRWAARHLIDPHELRAAAAASPDPGVWCHELNVSADILERYLRDTRAA